MPRYVKQRDRYSCGPVAIINALKWAGYPASYDSIKYLRRLCKCKPYSYEEDWTGTRSGDFTAAIIKAGHAKAFYCQYALQPSVETVRAHLDSGGAVVVLVLMGEDAHYALFVGHCPGHILGINYDFKHAVIDMSTNSLRSLLKKGKIKGNLYPEVWLLSKPKEKNAVHQAV